MKKLFKDKKRKIDVILIAALLIISGVLYVVINNTGTVGGEAVVRVKGEVVASYKLSDDGTYPLNGGTNILVIEDGCAYICEADCPDKYCMEQGKIQYTGQCLTCLPNKLTVTIEGGEDNGIDFMS